MQPFLEYVLEDLVNWTDSQDSFVFILPSKRAGFFLRNHIARRAPGALLLPEIWSIEDFVQEISGIRTAGSLHLLFRLYEAYLDQDGLDRESFGDFMKWGPLLLQDFNEIDRYLTPAEKLFQTLSALNEIRQWTPDLPLDLNDAATLIHGIEIRGLLSLDAAAEGQAQRWPTFV